VTAETEETCSMQDRGKIILALDGACIQTAAKRAHRELTVSLLKAGEASDAERAGLETLAAFLSSEDFPALRARHPELAGGTSFRVALWRGPDGAVRWEIFRPPCS